MQGWSWQEALTKVVHKFQFYAELWFPWQPIGIIFKKIYQKPQGLVVDECLQGWSLQEALTKVVQRIQLYAELWWLPWQPVGIILKFFLSETTRSIWWWKCAGMILARSLKPKLFKEFNFMQNCGGCHVNQ